MRPGVSIPDSFCRCPGIGLLCGKTYISFTDIQGFGVPCASMATMQNQTCILTTSADCLYTSWGAWSSCTESCDTGSQLRTREITRQSQGSGIPCGALYQTQACGTTPCNVDPCIANPCRLGLDNVTDTIGLAFTCAYDPTALDNRTCSGQIKLNLPSNE